MFTNFINHVHPKPVGSAPILVRYFEKCGIVDMVNEHVPTDPRRKVLTHGQACLVMVTGILFQVMQFYRICQFAKETAALDALLPGIAPPDYFDDRLADSLDALYDSGPGNLGAMITGTMKSLLDTASNTADIDTYVEQRHHLIDLLKQVRLSFRERFQSDQSEKHRPYSRSRGIFHQPVTHVCFLRKSQN